VNADPATQALRTAYKDYIGHLLGLAGLDRVAERAEAVMALEAAIAQTQATGDAAESDHNAGNLWTRHASLVSRSEWQDVDLREDFAFGAAR
jgi:hypothetical protein